MQINQLVRTLLQKESLDECSLQEIEMYADRHPFFGAAQLLLAKKLQQEKPDLFPGQLQKTLLFFHNPLWVEKVLNDAGEASWTEPVSANEVQTPADELITESATPNSEEKKENEATSVNIPTVVEANPIVEPPAVELSSEEPVTGELTVAGKTDDVTDVETPAQLKEIAIDIPTLPPLNDQPVDTGLVFEPYHTVDYFASQGIRIREEDLPKDRFGEQLKSFTAWLRTMKKIGTAEVAASVAPKSEEKVERLAEKSITSREIVTETMAEVWEKQGNTDRAIAVYEKLSLLEPSKSAYFAAKIEELKKQN